jgi:hypothetical protein
MIYAYMRFSSDNQIGGVSIEMQRTAIMTFVRGDPKLSSQMIAERIDEAKSGTIMKGRDAHALKTLATRLRS